MTRAPQERAILFVLQSVENGKQTKTKTEQKTQRAQIYGVAITEPDDDDDAGQEVEKENRAPEVGETWLVWTPDVGEREMEETSAVNGINKDNAHVFELDVCTILKVNPGEGDVADTYDVSFDELDDPELNNVVSRFRCFAQSPFWP